MIFPIERKMTDKKHSCVFLLSTVNTEEVLAKIWSVHKYEGDLDKTPLSYYKEIFQQDHDKQIRDILLKEVLNEPEEYRTRTVQDLTQFG
jgi:hypothetical protein